MWLLILETKVRRNVLAECLGLNVTKLVALVGGATETGILEYRVKYDTRHKVPAGVRFNMSNLTLGFIDSKY